MDIEFCDGGNLAPYGETAIILPSFTMGFYASPGGAGFRPTVPFLWVAFVDDV